jgi:hypothetical protein
MLQKVRSINVVSTEQYQTRFAIWKQGNGVIQGLALSYDNEMTLTGQGKRHFLIGQSVSANYLVSGRCAAGRATLYGPGRPTRRRQSCSPEQSSLANGVSVRSQRRRQGNCALGKLVHVGGGDAPSFDYPTSTELWIPVAMGPVALPARRAAGVEPMEALRGE